MTKRMLSIVAVLVAAGITLFAGALQAHGANEFDATFGGQYSLGGFEVSYGGGENGTSMSAILSVSSTVHRIGSVNCYFATDPTDPSQAYGSIYISGIENAPLNHSASNMVSVLNFGDVFLYQEMNYGYGYDRNGVSAIMSVGLLDLSFGVLHNYRYTNTYPDQPPQTYFSYVLEFYGSFGPGEAGDALGRPFAQVPTPGALGCFGLAGLAVLRRTGRR